MVPSVGPSSPESDGYTVSLPEPAGTEMPELQPSTIEMENSGEELAGPECMSESPPSRRYPESIIPQEDFQTLWTGVQCIG